MQKRNASCAVIASATSSRRDRQEIRGRRISVFAGRRNGEKLEPLVKEVEATGGTIFGRSLDARKETRSRRF